MGRNRQRVEPEFDRSAEYLAAAIVAAVGGVVAGVIGYDWAPILGFFIAVPLSLTWLVAWAGAGRRHRRLRRLVQEAAARHYHALGRRRMATVRPNDYGHVDDSRWTKELVRFVEVEILSSEPTLIRAWAAINGELLATIDNVAMQSEQSLMAVTDEPEVNRHEIGSNFEFECATALRRAGWKAEVTKGSRDQGVDIVATRQDGRRLALQCKRFSRPVGNKAVQEVAAGKRFVGAHWAAVVTNNDFTPGARQLARANGVVLLHVTDLTRLEYLLPGSAPES